MSNLVFKILSLSGSILETNYQTRNGSLFFFFSQRFVGMLGGGGAVQKMVAKREEGFF